MGDGEQFMVCEPCAKRAKAHLGYQSSLTAMMGGRRPVKLPALCASCDAKLAALRIDDALRAGQA